MFYMAPHGKELSEDLRIRIVALHNDGLGYKKFGNSLKLSYSTVARVTVIWLCVELYLEDSKSVLLYMLHIDYSKIYPSLICAVLSLEKLY